MSSSVTIVEKISQSTYAPYGDVISSRQDIKPVPANMGTAKRYNYLTEVRNLWPSKSAAGGHSSARANVCVFQCTPMVKTSDGQFEIKILERHQNSTQVFVPMSDLTKAKYLVVVCLGNKNDPSSPDLSTLKVFFAEGSQGISYHPGVWHHPLIAMDQETTFACLVFEDDTVGAHSDENNHVVNLSDPVLAKW